MAIETNRLLQLEMKGKGFAIVMTYELTETQQGTLLNQTMGFGTQSGFMKFLGKLFAGFTKKLARKQMERLKKVAEEL